VCPIFAAFKSGEEFKMKPEKRDRLTVIRKENAEPHPVGTAASEHAWKGTWERPMKINPEGLDPFTIARMTDHNVRGTDENGNENDEETAVPVPTKKAA
jgi:hypothetical protein